MNLVNYMDYLSIDSIILNDKKYHNIRELYRLFLALGRYYNACITQFNRIEEWATKQRDIGSRTVPSSEFPELLQVFADIHFLLISMDKCYKLESKLYFLLLGAKKETDFSSSEEVNKIRLMRNALEHMEENMGKQTTNNKYNIPQIYTDNGYSWLEYQYSHLSKGVFQIKDLELEFSKTMFNHINEHMDVISQLIQARVDKIQK